MRRWVLLVQSLALSAVLMCPAPGGFGARAIGSEGGDIAKHLWTLWWMRKEAMSGEPGLLTRMINFPDGVELWPIDPLDGLLGLLVPLPPVGLANALAFLHLTLLGLAAGWLGRVASGSRLGGYVAGALAQGSAFAAFTLHVGVGELRQLWWLPLGLACMVRAHETTAWRWFIALGLAGAGATISSFYHGAFLGLATAAFLVLAPPRTPRALAGFALSLALAGAVVLPVARTFAGSYGPAAAVSEAASETSVETSSEVRVDARGAAASIDDLYLPRAWARGRMDAVERAYTGGRYLGFVAIGLAVAGLAAAPRRALPWVGVAGVGVVFSLGSVPHVGGEPLAGWSLPLPFALLDGVLARVAEPVNFPARFLAITMVALPVLAAFATRWRRVAWLVPIAIVEIQAADLVPWPRETFSLPSLRGLSGKGPMLDLGILLDDSQASRTLDMAAQMTLSSPTQAVPIDRLDRWNVSGNHWARALPLTQALATRTPTANRVTETYRPDLALLRARGFERLLLTHPSDALDPQYDGLLTALCGPPQRTTLATLWTLPNVKVAPEDLARWTVEHEARVAALPPELLPGEYPTSPGLR
jgi:hypothetical protein